jgi:hypothetical protein
LIDPAYEQAQAAGRNNVRTVHPKRQHLWHKSSDKLKVSANEGARDDNSHVAPAKLAQGDNEDI